MRKAVWIIFALALLLATPDILWAPYGGVGGLPVPQELEDLDDVEASSLAADQDAVVWNSLTQSYIHTVGGVGDMTKAVYDADSNSAIDDTVIPDDITIDLAATATALAANGANCAAGNYPLGVDASGAAEDCTALGGGGDMTKAVYDADNSSAIDDTAIPNDITIDLAAAATALAANGANCGAGEVPLGVDGSGAAEGCYEPAFTDVTGAVTDTQVPNTITVDEPGIAAAIMRDAEWTAATLTAAGKAELATIEETNTGTDAERAVTPDGLDGWTGNAAALAAFSATGLSAHTGSAEDHMTHEELEAVLDLDNLQGILGSDQAADDMARDSEVTRAATESHAPMFYWTISGSAITPTTYPLVKVKDAITITDIYCITDTGEVSIQLEEGTSTAFDGGVVVDATSITCDSNGAEDDGTLSNGPIDANDWIAARIGTDASDPTMVGITVFYTVN